VTQWWRVKPPIDSEFLVLVADGLVAVYTREYELFDVGDRWRDVRKRLEESQFACVMVAS